ncbi:hypothetical protein V6N13_020293 [Hibiscus sabdariffa]
MRSSDRGSFYNGLTTVENETWGSFLKIDSDTTEPQSFESGSVFIETKRMGRISETIDLVVNSEIYPVRVKEIEYPYKNEHSEDFSVGMSDDEDDSTHGKHRWSDSGVEAGASVARLDSSPISNSKYVNSQETIVPNSTELVLVDHDQTKLELSMCVDLRVCNSQDNRMDVFSDAATRLINRCGEELPKFDVMQFSELHVSPIAQTNGPLVDTSDTSSRAITFKKGDVDRKVRYFADLMQKEMTTTKQHVSKRAKETTDFGKLIGVVTLGNEKDVVKGITRLFEESEGGQ